MVSASTATAIDDEVRKRNQLTLSALESVAPEMIEDAVDAGLLDFAGWTLLSTGEAGEAQATAAAFLTSDPASPFERNSDFLLLETYQKGGKPKRASDAVLDRVWNEIRNTVVFWHPTNTVVIQAVPTLDKPQIEGQAPPFPEIDPNGQIVSVVMVRNLGTHRLPAALMTIGSLIIFLVSCWMLHVRDLELRRRTAEWDPAAAT